MAHSERPYKATAAAPRLCLARRAHCKVLVVVYTCHSHSVSLARNHVLASCLSWLCGKNFLKDGDVPTVGLGCPQCHTECPSFNLILLNTTDSPTPLFMPLRWTQRYQSSIYLQVWPYPAPYKAFTLQSPHHKNMRVFLVVVKIPLLTLINHPPNLPSQRV